MTQHVRCLALALVAVAFGVEIGAFAFLLLGPLLLWVVMALTLASSGALDFVGLGTAASVFSSIGEWFFASMTMPASAYLSIGAIGGGVFLAVTIGFSWKSFCSSSSDG